MEAKVYNQDGKETGSVALPEQVFGLPWNNDLIYQVVTSTETSRRSNTAQVKDRSAVRGGGKKPWRQKGTGRARHGSIRSPLWRGGGVTHGPTTERNYFRKVNRKVKNKALGVVLSRKFKDGEILFLDQLNLPVIKTKTAFGVLTQLSKLKGFEKVHYRRGSRVLLAMPRADEKLQKSFRNLGGSTLAETRNLNPVDILSYKYLVIADPKASLETLKNRLS